MTLPMMSTNIITVTDEEPDDILALAVLKKSGKYNITHRFVLGTPDSTWNRQANAAQLDALLGVVPHVYREDHLKLVYDLLQIIADVAAPILFWTCCALALHDIYLLDPQLLKKCTIYMYGSVNIRWAFKPLAARSPIDKKTFFEMLNHGVGDLRVFETYWAFGPNNTANPVSTPEMMTQGLITRSIAGDPLESFIDDQMHAWNQDILDEIIPRLQIDYPLLPAPEYYLSSFADPVELAMLDVIAGDPHNRHASKAMLIKNIATHKGYQMVFADFGLAAVMCDESYAAQFKNVRISANEYGFIVLEPDATTSIKYWRPDSVEGHLHRLSITVCEIMGWN